MRAPRCGRNSPAPQTIALIRHSYTQAASRFASLPITSGICTAVTVFRRGHGPGQSRPEVRGLKVSDEDVAPLRCAGPQVSQPILPV
jgi:hypothetical protein